MTLLDARGSRPDGWVYIEGDTIRGTGSGRQSFASDLPVFDAEGTVTPGFIDIHCHGGGGHAYDDGVDDIVAGVAAHARSGTTRSLVSLVSAPLDRMQERLADVARAMAREPGILGAHLEGPFLSGRRRGAHDPEALTDPDPAAVEGLLAAAENGLRQVTLDPLRPGARAALDRFVAAGVAVAVGHTEAGYDDAAAAFDAGATLLTHAFNAMPGLHHRDPGPVLAAVERDVVRIELILDGVHVHPALAARLFALAPHRVALVTDAMAAAGAPEGAYRLGPLDICVAGGRALVAGTDTLAGSLLTTRDAFERARTLGIGEAEAVEALTLTPARAIGRSDRFGLLAEGYAADLLFFSPKGELRRVVRDGVDIRPPSHTTG